MLLNPQTPAGVRLKAIEWIMSLNELNEPAPQHSDRQELMAFLIEHRIRLDDVKAPFPPEYLQAYKDLLLEVVEGEFTDIGILPPGGGSTPGSEDHPELPKPGTERE